MKSIYSLLFIILCFWSYGQSENREIPKDILKAPKDFPDGETFILNQDELEKKYSENYTFYAILKDQFFNFNNASSEIVQLVYIDFEYIQVFESKEIHAVTYNVEIRTDEQEEELTEVYNLMHFSNDYKTYYFILLKYNFSEIAYEDYIENPHENSNILSFIPLTHIGNIYENIAYSFAQELLINPNLLSLNSPFYNKIIDFANCAKIIDVEGIPCKSCGLNFREVVDGKWCTHTEPETRPRPAYTYMDLSDCEKQLNKDTIDLVSFE